MLSNIYDTIARLKVPHETWGWRRYPLVGSMWFYRRWNRNVPETSIWDHDWDLLVVLDACRVDWMEAVSDEYSFIDSVDSVWSVGSHSEEWLERTFTEGPTQELRETAYVSANHFVERHIQEDRLASFYNVNDDVGGEDGLVVPPAHMTTDRAVEMAREGSWDRLVVHYMQPHKPFFVQSGDRRNVEVRNWSVGIDLYRNYFSGEISYDQLKGGFIDNLRYALDEVSLLLENVDADKAVLTADHGQALGEHFLWDHRRGVRHPVVRGVPWVETSAIDEGTVEPKDYQVRSNSSVVKERLEQLGYR